MRYTSTFIACLTLLLCSSTLRAETLPPSGINDKVEWQVRTNWKIEEEPLDIVHSLDGKMVFILDKQHRVLVYDNQGVLQGRIPVSKGVTTIDIAPQGEALYLVDQNEKTFTAVSLSYITEIDVAGSPFKGKVDAPVTLAVFTDFECPYCRKIEPLLNEVFEKNKDTVKLVFKNMPLTKIHTMADPAHRAALAAEMQGKFWEYHDRIFTAEKLTNQLLDQVAQDLGLDMEKFKKDMNSSVVRNKIRKDMIDARNAGVTGTPTVFINGRKPMQRSLQGFQQIIDEELAKAGR